MSSRFHSLLIANEWSDPGEVNRAQSEHCVVRGQKSPVHCDEFFFFLCLRCAQSQHFCQAYQRVLSDSSNSALFFTHRWTDTSGQIKHRRTHIRARIHTHTHTHTHRVLLCSRPLSIQLITGMNFRTKGKYSTSKSREFLTECINVAHCPHRILLKPL